jgi:hypothetical protein
MQKQIAMSKLRILSRTNLFFLLFIISACASYDLESNYQHGVNLNSASQTARTAVEHEFKVNLGSVKWELADMYRLNRLTYKIANDEYKVMVSHPFYARILSEAASSVSSEDVLGLYKENIKKIFINPQALEDAYSFDLEDRELARQIYLALFIHEFVHAADFEKFSNTMKDESYKPGQSELLGALLEGHAEYISEKLCEEYECREGYDILENGSRYKTKKDGSEKSSKNKELSKIYRAELKFKYSFGKKYISEKYRKSPDEDPIPRELSELPNSPMLILYPDNSRLINNSYKTTYQMMRALTGVKREFSDEEYIYHYEVFLPPRVLALLDSITGEKTRFSKNSPLYLQAITLKLYDLSDENYYDFENYSYLMFLLDMGGDKSYKLIQNLSEKWESEFNTKSIISESLKQTEDLKYISSDQLFFAQFNSLALFVVSQKNKLDENLLLRLSENVLGSL